MIEKINNKSKMIGKEAEKQDENKKAKQLTVWLKQGEKLFLIKKRLFSQNSNNFSFVLSIKYFLTLFRTFEK